MTADMDDIDALARDLADSRNDLKHTASVVEQALDAVRRQYLPELEALAARVAAAGDRLHAAVAAQPELFQRPRTRTLHGIKVGWAKQPGRLVIARPEAVLVRIRQHLPDQAESLIRVRETPDKTALAKLPASDLRKLGVTLESDRDAPVVKPADSETDKLVDALIAAALGRQDREQDA